MAKKKISKAQRRRKRRRVILGVEIIVLMLLLGTLYLYSKLSLINFAKDGVQAETNDLDAETTERLKGYTTIALFGVDNRQFGDYENGNSDTIIVLNINNDTKEIKMMSVYRDTYLNVYDDFFFKCNNAYANGGAQKSVDMLNRNLDLNISKFVAVDFQALIDAVDAVGGIEVDIQESGVANAMNTLFNDRYEYKWAQQASNPYVSTGPQTLNGVQALAYARVRKSDNDFKRTERQREVVAKLIDKAKHASIPELNNLAEVIFPKIYTNFTVAEIISMAAGVKDYDLTDTAGFPFEKTTMMLGSKGDIVVPCSLLTNVSKAHEFLFNEPDYYPTNTVTQISNKIITDTGKDENDAVEY